MKNAKSRLVLSTARACSCRILLGGSSIDRGSLVTSTGSGAPASAPAGGSLAVRLVLLGLLIASLITLAAPPAQGAYLHTTIVGEYGKEGPKATGTGNGCRLAWHESSDRLFLYSDTKIYGLQRTAPGSVTPLGGGFPISLPGIGSSCGDRDMAVDNSGTASNGNLYVVPSSPSTVYGYNSTGSALASPWPVSSGGGETCGVSVGNNGNVFAGVYSLNQIKQFTSAGAPAGSFNFPEVLCKIEVDPSNNDVFVQPYGGGPIIKHTASSGYSEKITFPASGDGNASLAVNAAQNRIYVGNGGQIKAYDTDSASLLETVSTGGSVADVEVEESTDTLFVSGSGAIKEISGAIVPDVTTGNPEGNSKVTGSFDPAGGGEVTECYFEFGTTTSYGTKEPCSPAGPYPGPGVQAVTANLPGLLGEQTYNYRLVAHNANGKNVGGNKTITPHYVEGLATDDAENVTRTAAKMKAHFEGNGEETFYYFEWGTTTAYGTKSAVPPGPSKGSPVGPTNLDFDATGLLPDTTYNYRVVATNPKGVSPGNNKTFKTLPAVQSLTTGSATNITAVSATLNGSYNGDGDATSYHYEYGKTMALGQTTAPQNAGPAVGATQLPANVSGLTLDTIYYYRVVATNSLGTTKGTIQNFNTKKAVENLVTKPATSIDDETITLNAEFEGTGLATSFYFEYGPTTSYGQVSEEAPGTPAGVTTGATPVSSEIDEFEGFTTYHYRVVATNVNGTTVGNDETFQTPETPLPEVDNTAVSGVTSNAATFSAVINPNHWPTVYLFEWGQSTAYGSETLIGNPIDGLDNQGVPVQATVGNLTPGVRYHFRIVAINFAGVTNGPDLTFVTPGVPRIEESSASAITQTTARLSALASGSGSPTNMRFEYGPTGSYGLSTSPSPIGDGLQTTLTEADLSGLTPGTTYHYRAVGTNAVGTTHGLDQTFTTQPKPEDKVQPPPPVKCKKGFVKRKGKCVKRKRAKKKKRNG